MTVVVNFSFRRNVRSVRPKRLIRTSNGDTPVIEHPIRMVSCDTPEKAQYAGRPEISQPKLSVCRERLNNGFYADIPEELRSYLSARLTDDAAERHIQAGERASHEFDAVLARRLTKPNGKTRRVATIPTGQLIDSYGRLLA